MPSLELTPVCIPGIEINFTSLLKALVLTVMSLCIMPQQWRVKASTMSDLFSKKLSSRKNVTFLLQFELAGLLLCCVLCRIAFGVELALIDHSQVSSGASLGGHESVPKF